MRILATVLGALGAVAMVALGILIALLGQISQTAWQWQDSEGTFAMILLAFSLVSVVGGALVWAKPLLSAAMLAAAFLGATVFLSTAIAFHSTGSGGAADWAGAVSMMIFCAVPGLISLLGAVFAFLQYRRLADLAQARPAMQ